MSDDTTTDPHTTSTDTTSTDTTGPTASPGSKREKKEKVIHTRVPQSLDEEIRDRAEALGISVSNLVRNVLGHAFGLVEDVISDGAAIARSAKGREKARKEATSTGGVPSYGDGGASASVIGWQMVVMNINAVCAQCNTIIAKGNEAAVALTDGSSARPVLCSSCLQEMKNDSPDSPDSTDTDSEPAGPDSGGPTG